MKIEMKIRQLFKLANGATILVGEVAARENVSGHRAALIGPDGVVVQTITLIGEHMPRAASRHPEERAYETADPVALSPKAAERGGWLLQIDKSET